MVSVHLLLFGGARIEANGVAVAGRASQRRRIALLTLLALSPRRALGRERVIGHLWPDHPPDAARRLLSESLYVVRRALGEEALLSRGDELILGQCVTSDVESFLVAIEAGELERAVALYRGPLLDGWYVRDAPEFERWAEAERARIAAIHGQALRQLAATREAADDWPGAAELWRELLRVDPYSSIATWHAARALAVIGERAAALQALAAHGVLLETDLGVGLGADLVALTSHIRSGADVRPERAPSTPPSPMPESRLLPSPTAGASEAIPETTVEGLAGTTASMPRTGPGLLAGPMLSTVPTVPPQVPGVDDRRRTAARAAVRWLMGAAVVLTLTILASWRQLGHGLDSHSTQAGRVAALDPHRVAVLYFEDRSTTGELEYLADGLTEGLIRELTGLRQLRVLSQDAVRPVRGRPVRLDSLARALGAGTIVGANLWRDGSQVRVAMRLVDGATGDQLAAEVFTRPQGAPMAMADELATRVAAALRRRLGERLIDSEEAPEIGRPADGDRALELLFRAKWLRRQAALTRLGSTRSPTPDSARALLRAADSLLAAAEGLAPAWPRPAIERGWVAVTAGRLEHGPARVVALAPGLAHAERALTLLRVHAPSDSVAAAPALYLRGELRVRAATAVQTFRPESTTLRSGADDLRAAVAADPGLAGAWATLAMAEWVGANFDGAEAAAARAIEADAYLVEAPDVIGWAWLSMAAAGRRDDAERWCLRGRQMVPQDWHFVECELSLMRLDVAGISGRRPDPARAQAIAQELERIDPASRAKAAGHPYSPYYRRLVVAAVLASAGMRDSAASILSSTLLELRDDAELSTDVLYDAAFLRFVLGDTARAERDLAAYVRARPDLTRLLERDRLIEAVRARTPRAAAASLASPDATGR